MGKIYCITNCFNDKKYIGQTTERYLNTRLRKHRAASRAGIDTLFYRAMRKYGESNFKIQLLEEVEDNILSEKEIEWIKKLNTVTPNGYNSNYGGIAMFGENNPFFGKSHNNETKSYLSELAKQKTGKNNPFYNKNHSEKSKKLISQTHIKYKNIKMYKNNVLVNSFINLKEAYNWLILNVNIKSKKYSTISGCIVNSVKNNKQYYGYTWIIEKDVETIENIS